MAYRRDLLHACKSHSPLLNSVAKSARGDGGDGTELFGQLSPLATPLATPTITCSHARMSAKSNANNSMHVRPQATTSELEKSAWHFRRHLYRERLRLSTYWSHPRQNRHISRSKATWVGHKRCRDVSNLCITIAILVHNRCILNGSRYTEVCRTTKGNRANNYQ
jgi:hypothetical protein